MANLAHLPNNNNEDDDQIHTEISDPVTDALQALRRNDLAHIERFRKRFELHNAIREGVKVDLALQAQMVRFETDQIESENLQLDQQKKIVDAQTQGKLTKLEAIHVLLERAKEQNSGK